MCEILKTGNKHTHKTDIISDEEYKYKLQQLILAASYIIYLYEQVQAKLNITQHTDTQTKVHLLILY